MNEVLQRSASSDVLSQRLRRIHSVYGVSLKRRTTVLRTLHRLLLD